MNIYIRIHTYIHIHTYMFTHMCVHTHTHTYTYIHTPISTRVFMYLYVCIYIYTGYTPVYSPPGPAFVRVDMRNQDTQYSVFYSAGMRNIAYFILRGYAEYCVPLCGYTEYCVPLCGEVCANKCAILHALYCGYAQNCVWGTRTHVYPYCVGTLNIASRCAGRYAQSKHVWRAILRTQLLCGAQRLC